MPPWLIGLTIGLPWLGAACVWLVGDGRRRAQHAIAVGFAVAAGLAGLALLPFVTKEVALRLPIGGVFGDLTFVPDGLGVFLAVIATVIGSLAVIFSVDYMRGEAQVGRYYALVLIFIGAMAGLVLTGSLLYLFLFWEITAFCSYALISFHNDDPKAVAGGIKALIITSLGGIGLLAGALVLRAYLGGYEISAALASARALPPTVLSLVAFGFLAAAAAKSAQVPFQTWLPDAMEAPTPVSALIHAATMVNAGVYLLARFYPAFAEVPGWRTAVIAVGALSALLAAVLALLADDIKRVLAYSTISQLGYMVYAIGLGAVFASQLHLLSHAVFKALLFLGAGSVIHSIGTRDLQLMGGLGRQMPFVRNVFVIGALALVGVPILSGFWSKELILEAALEHGPWLLFLGVLGAAVTALYTTRLVWLAFFGEPRVQRHAHDAGPAMRVSLGLLALGTLTTWLLAGLLERMLTPCLESACTLGAMVSQVSTAPSTLIALAGISAGIAGWWWWQGRAFTRSPVLARMAASGFGFEWINKRIVASTRAAASALRALQTGQLNWNVAGIVGGLILVLAILMWSA
jgi:NADH-quinone oxidoreductase subunit L